MKRTLLAPVLLVTLQTPWLFGEPPATQPASAPALTGEIAERWKAWKQAWSAGEWDKLTAAEAALGSVIRRANKTALLALVSDMQTHVQPLAGTRPEAYRRVRLAYMIFTTQGRLGRLSKPPSPPHKPDEKALPRFLAAYRARRRARAEMALCGFRLIEDAAGAIGDPERKTDALTRAFYLMPSVGFFCLPFVDETGPLLARFRKVKPALEAFARTAPPQPERDVRKHYRTALKGFEEALDVLARRADDKRVIRRLLKDYVAGYNGKQDGVLIEVFGGTDADKVAAATQPSAGPAARIPPSRSTIALLEPYAIHVSDDTAGIDLFVRYRDRAGKLGPIGRSSFRARRTPRGWRLVD